MRPKTKSEVPIGTVLSGRYRISREIGRGGMAAVYEATHVEIGKRVAVKVLDSALASNDTVIERFNREARAAASVESPNICEVFDVGRLDDGRPYLVMELLEGESLYERMVHEAQLKISDTVRILSQVGRGLARAHAAGIIHRDLKPENIFLHRNAEGEEVAKLVDFGLAKFHTAVSATDTRLTREGAIFGTPLYMSPEQVSGQGHADHRSDLWALGCIAFECLTGRPIWPVDRGMAYIFAQIVTQPLPVPSSVRPDLPHAFDTWFNRALQRDPAERYQNAQQMVLDLATALGHDPTGLVSAPAILPMFSTTASPVVVNRSRPEAPTADKQELLGYKAPDALAPTEPPPPFSGEAQPKSRRGLIAAAAGAGLVALGAVAAVVWFSRTPEDAADSSTEKVPVVSADASSTASASASVSAPSALPSWASAIRQSQKQLASGRAREAVAILERAVERSDHPALLTMLSQARIAAANDGPCSVVALGRPRDFDDSEPARSATVLSSGEGALLAWTTTSVASAHSHASFLDRALEQVRGPMDVAPGAQQVVDAKLTRAGATPVLLFVDGGERKGPWLQRFGASGGLSGSAIRVATHTGSRSDPWASEDSNRRLWIAYTDRSGDRAMDVFVRRIDDDTLSEPIRLTDHGSIDAGDGRDAASPRLAFAGNQAQLVYVRQTLRENEVVFHRVGPVQDMMTGKARRTPDQDTSRIVTENKLKVHAVAMACDDRTCFVGWRNEPSGSHMAALDAGSGEVLWRKTFASGGTDLAVASAPDGKTLMVWFDRSRLRGATLTREGMGATSILGIAHGGQSAPSLVADGQAGSWLAAWTCFEGGRPEVFVARLACK